MASTRDKKIIVLANNGKSKPYTNSCMFISICDYLRYVLRDLDVTVRTLREYSKFTGKNSMFDTSNKKHLKSLSYITKKYNLSIYIHYFNSKSYKKYISKFCHRFGDGSNALSILYYGNHFELLLSCGEFTDRLQVNHKLINNDERKILTTSSIYENNICLDIEIEEYVFLKEELKNQKYLKKINNISNSKNIKILEEKISKQKNKIKLMYESFISQLTKN